MYPRRRIWIVESY